MTGHLCDSDRIEILPRPLGTVDLVVQLLGHDVFGVNVVEMCQVHYSTVNITHLPAHSAVTHL